MKALITRKLGMTSAIQEDGTMSAVTLLSASPNKVVQVKTTERDGYQAVQLGFGESSKAGKSAAGQSKGSAIKPVDALSSHL